jgi:hypothetical protein
MKHLELFESFPRNKHILNICWYNAKIGDVLPESDIYQYVEYLHRNEEDFTEGDLFKRIEEFSKYELKEVSIKDINIDEYYLDDDYMQDYINKFKDANDYPPIVLDGDTKWSYKNNYTIIDGTHRVNALDKLKVKKVKAWIGNRL